jgi:hypothetical protein
MGTFFTSSDHLRATMLTAVCAVAALASTFFIVGCGGTVQAQRDIDFNVLIGPPLSNRSFSNDQRD